jgi:hypothetical protein
MCLQQPSSGGVHRTWHRSLRSTSSSFSHLASACASHCTYYREVEAANFHQCMILKPCWDASPVIAALFRALAADAVCGTGDIAAALTSNCRSTPCCAGLLPQRHDTPPHQLQLVLAKGHVCAGQLVLADVAQVRISHRNSNGAEKGPQLIALSVNCQCNFQDQKCTCCANPPHLSGHQTVDESSAAYAIDNNVGGGVQVPLPSSYCRPKPCTSPRLSCQLCRPKPSAASPREFRQESVLAPINIMMYAYIILHQCRL